MKRKFTFLAAALALLAFLTIPLGMWGQTETTIYSEAGGTTVQGWTFENNVTGQPINQTPSSGAYWLLQAGDPGDYIQTSAYDLSDYASASLSLQAATYGSGTNPTAVVQVSFDNGTTFTNVELLGNQPTSNTYQTLTGTISSGLTNSVVIKYSNGITDGKGLRLKNVVLTATDGAAPTTHTVTYYSNISGVSSIVDTFNEGVNVTLRGADTFTNEGYSFSEWNTQADGDGDAYDAGDVIESIDDDIELYAIWTEAPTPTGSDVTFDATQDLGNTTAGEGTIEKDGVTFTCSNGILGNGTEYRLYKNSVTTFSVASGTITKIVFTCTSGNPASGFASQTGWITSGNNGTWTGSAESVSFTASGAQVRATQIVVTVETSGIPDPTISASNVDIAYNANGGSITYTINNEPSPAGTLTAATTADWIMLPNSFASPIAFTCTVNQSGTAREGVVILTYTYGDNQTATKDVTITQAGDPNYTMTIAEVRTLSTGTTVATKGVVTSISVSGNNKTAYLQDNTAGIVAFGPFTTTVVVGDEIRVEGELTAYHGLLEIGKSNSAPTVTVLSQNNTVTPVVKTIAEISNDIQAQLVKVENATVTAIDGQNTTIAQGQNSIVVRGIDGVEYGIDDVLTLTANVGCYDNPQLANPTDVIVQQSTEPSITVTPTTLNVEAGQHVVNDELTITFDNIDVVNYESFTIQFYNAEGEGQEMPEWLVLGVTGSNDEGYQVNGYISANEGEARTAYFKVSAQDAEDNTVYSNLVTVNQEAYVAPTYAELPFAFNGGKADIENTDGLSQEGLGSDYGTENAKLRFDDTGDWLLLQFNERPGTLTFDIKGNSFSGGTFKVQTSEDGTTYTDLATYTELPGTAQTEEFNNLGENVRYIKWIYTEKVSGNVGLGNITLAEYTAPQPSITVTPTEVSISAEGATGALTVTCENIDDSYEIGVRFYEDPQTPATNPAIYEDWFEIVPAGGSSNDFHYEAFPNEGNARTAYLTICAFATNGEMLTESQLVTINQAAYVIPFEGGTYTLATSIEEGRIYIIVGKDGEDAYAMGDQNSNNRGAVGISIDDNTATVEEEIEAYEFYIESLGEDNLYCIYDFRKEGFLYAASSSSNHLKTEAALDENGNGNWAISIEDGVASIVAQGTNSRKVMQYNSDNTLFSCYGSASQKPVYLYVKEEETPEPETYELTINGYTDAESKAGYYLIASPVTVNIADVAGLAEGDFDLYSYDESQELEWINYKQEDGSHPFTTLEPGKGYLYAKKATAETSTYTFTLTGTPYYGTPIVLSKQSDGKFAGWNLIGNPLATSNIAPRRDFYIMNSTSGELIASESNTVEPMQGFFVIADEDGEEFGLTAPLGGDGNLDKLVMNLSRNCGTVIDRAIVRFGEGRQLPKFQLNPNNTKIYVTEGDQDFAVVRSASQADMPVSFKASENGTYTIAVEAENVNMNYLHLIDNMTGADVDLLTTPNYTFEARTNDYTSRFRLVFSANGTTDNEAETFAYFNGSNWTVNNLGEATLQVVDVTGRTVSCETINGNATISLNQTPGVYMFRLVSGNGVKVQKVVVK